MSNVLDFGASGDGITDDTDAIQHAVNNGDGVLQFPRGTYRIVRPIEVRLDRLGPFGIDGSTGTATVVMTGPGPAFRLVGTHRGTGEPSTLKPTSWQAERLPTIKNITIEGKHSQADGIDLIETMQSVFEGILIRKVRHGIHLQGRNRNVLISHSHVYFNTGVGIYLDRVNLHQINIMGNHISYNRLGGIRIEGSEVRNLQITGNDIEYNNHKVHSTDPEPTAEIYIDTTAKGASVNEITVASNTIQATASPGGANIRILAPVGQDRPPGLWTISGNIIGSQENNVYLTGCHGIIINGNFIYSCANRNLLIEYSSQINIGSNSFRRHTSNMNTGIRLIDSSDCVIHGCTIQDETDEGQTTTASLFELANCQRISITGCQFLDGVPFGIDVEQSSHININGCTVMDTRKKQASTGAVRFRGRGVGNLISSNTISRTIDKALQFDDESNVRLSDNATDF